MRSRPTTAASTQTAVRTSPEPAGRCSSSRPRSREAASLAGIANPNICDPADAIPAAAALLAHDGAPANWQRGAPPLQPEPGIPRRGHDLGEPLRHGGPGRLAARWQDHPGLRTDLAHARGTSGLPGQVLPALPLRHRHRRANRHAGPGVAAGKVVFAGRDSSGAVVVEIEHLPNVISLYGHLEDPPAVKVGDVVVTGQVVGDVGVTGVTTGPHLHFAIYEAGVPVDPLTVLPPKG